jgi:anti-sigma factor RsiW
MEIEMITCERAKQEMSAYSDGELPEPLAAEVSAHLSGCGECAQYHDDLIALGALLDAPASIRASEDFTQNVLIRVLRREEESAFGRLGRAIWRPMPGWAAAAAIFLAIALGSGTAWLVQPASAPPARIAEAGGISNMLGLDAFEPLPADGIGGAYVQVAWPQDGEAR